MIARIRREGCNSKEKEEEQKEKMKKGTKGWEGERLRRRSVMRIVRDPLDDGGGGGGGDDDDGRREVC